MTRITCIDPETAEGRAKELLEATAAQLGRTPNLYRAMAQAPAALDGYLSFRAALAKGTLSSPMRERIALLVAAENACDYCVAAHLFRGSKLGLADDELSAVRARSSHDAKSRAALTFIASLHAQRGAITDAEFDEVKAAGWSDEEVGEMIAHVALNVLSNYFSHVARPALDFPPARTQAAP